MTAVEWLTEKFTECGFVFSGNIFEQAKQMEKEQIDKAHRDGYYREDLYDTRNYYNDNYGTKKS